MIVFIMIVIVVSIFEIRNTLKKKLIKELIIFCFIASITLYLGIIYYLDPYKYSFSSVLLHILEK